MSDDTNKHCSKEKTMNDNFQILSTQDLKETKIINEYINKESKNKISKIFYFCSI